MSEIFDIHFDIRARFNLKTQPWFKSTDTSTYLSKGTKLYVCYSMYIKSHKMMSHRIYKECKINCFIADKLGILSFVEIRTKKKGKTP